VALPPRRFSEHAGQDGNLYSGKNIWATRPAHGDNARKVFRLAGRSDILLLQSNTDDFAN